MTAWFIPATEDVLLQRALLHLGLNKAVRYYRELVVPGIGGVWFVRQLSWAAAGIYLATMEGQDTSKAEIAHAIEALACKLIWLKNNAESIRGKRAFARYPDEYSYKNLTQINKYYVQVTFRQSSVRALMDLGLTEGGMRFNSMELTPSGEAMVNAFLDNENNISIKKSLRNWIGGNKYPKSGKQFEYLGSKKASLAEKEILRDRLHADSIDEISDTERRKRLIDAFGKRNILNMPKIDDIKKNLNGTCKQQTKEIETAEAFDEMLSTARDLVHNTAEAMENSTSKPIKNFLSSNEIKDNIEKEISASKKYLLRTEKSQKPHRDALCFAKAIMDKKNQKEEVLKEIVQRDGVILSVSDGKIHRGSLFDRRRQNYNDEELDDEIGAEENSTKEKIRQLFTLCRDCINDKKQD